MIIQISETRRIKGGELAWELQRPRIRKGKAAWESFKWFNSFGSALESAVHEEIRLHPAQTLSEAIEVRIPMNVTADSADRDRSLRR